MNTKEHKQKLKKIHEAMLNVNRQISWRYIAMKTELDQIYKEYLDCSLYFHAHLKHWTNIYLIKDVRGIE